MPYIGRSSNFGVRSVFHFLASSGDTSVSGADADSKTLTFTDGNYIDVYLNGVRLKSGEDYNTNTANTVAGMSSLNANDEVNVVVYDAFSIANVLPLTGGNLTGDLGLQSDSSVLSFGADSDTTLTHTDGTGLTLNSTNKLTFGDAASFVQQSSDGTLRIDGEAIIDLNASTRVDVSGDLTVGDDLTLGSDGAILNFGADSEIQLIHVADTGLNIKHTATADDKPVVLTLQTGETDIAANDVLGTINFQAPDEGSGSGDNKLVAAGIEAVSEGDFSASSNATSLVFKTGASEAATEKMRINSAGAVAIGTSTPNNFGGFQCLTMGGAAATTGCVFDMEDSDGGIDGRVFAQDSFIAIAADPSNGSSNSKISFQVDSSEFAKIKTSGHFASRAGATSYIGSTANFHEFSTTENNLVIVRMAAQTASYADEGLAVGSFRASSNALSLISAFAGNGSSDAYSNRVFTVTGQGEIASDHSTSITSGADYAEYFEWKDGNSSNEDRIGQSVVLDGNKIRKATSDDSASSILGIISGNPSVVGDTAELRWQGMYELDDFNRRQTEEVEVWEWKDKVGFHSYESNKVPEGITVPSDKTVNKVVNDKYSSSYDASKKDDYVPRSQRKEWDAVGLMGKLRMLKGQPTGDRWIKMKDISDTVEEWLVR